MLAELAQLLAELRRAVDLLRQDLRARERRWARKGKWERAVRGEERDTTYYHKKCKKEEGGGQHGESERCCGRAGEHKECNAPFRAA